MKIKKLFFVLAAMLLSTQAFAFNYLAGVTEVKGPYWFPNDEAIWFGNYPSVSLEFDTAHTKDTIALGVGLESNTFLLVEKADLNSNLITSTKSQPTFHVHGSDGTSTTKWIEISHDGTNGLIDVGTGVVSFPDGISAAVTGNASTATALAANPTDCSANQFANAIAANGNLTCAAIADADVPDALTISGGTLNNSIIGGSTPAAATVTTLNVNTSVGKLTLVAEDVGATCAAGEMKLDTGGAAKELCYCEATDTWVCTTMASGPTD